MFYKKEGRLEKDQSNMNRFADQEAEITQTNARQKVSNFLN